MRVNRHWRTAAMTALLAAAGPGLLAAPPAAPVPLTVSAAWSRPTPPGAMGAAYLVITNQGARPDRLVSASTPAARLVEIDETRNVVGVSQMRALEALEVPPGRSVRLEPGALHIMLMDLPRPLAAGAHFPLTLRFRDAGAITVDVTVRDQP
jgi:copper(I)-binding protein